MRRTTHNAESAFPTGPIPQLPYRCGITTLLRKGLRGTFLIQPIEDHYATTQIRRDQAKFRLRHP